MLEQARFTRSGIVITVTLLSLLAACSESSPSRFYVLSAMQPAQNLRANDIARGKVIGVGPIDMPRYLDRTGFVSFTSRNRIELAEFDRWAEPLNDGFSRVLAENLGILTSADRVEIYPFTTGGRDLPDYQLVVEVIRLRSPAYGSVELLANWNIMTNDGRESFASGRVITQETIPGTGFDATAEAMSAAVATLSVDVANALRSPSRNVAR